MHIFILISLRAHWISSRSSIVKLRILNVILYVLNIITVELIREALGPFRKLQGGGIVMDSHSLNDSRSHSNIIWKAPTPHSGRGVGSVPYSCAVHFSSPFHTLRVVTQRSEQVCWPIPYVDFLPILHPPIACVWILKQNNLKLIKLEYDTIHQIIKFWLLRT